MKNTDKPYIVAVMGLLSICLISSNVSIFFLFSYSESNAFVHIRDFLERQEFYYFCDAYVEFLHEWGRPPAASMNETDIHMGQIY